MGLRVQHKYVAVAGPGCNPSPVLGDCETADIFCLPLVRRLPHSHPTVITAQNELAIHRECHLIYPVIGIDFSCVTPLLFNGQHQRSTNLPLCTSRQHGHRRHNVAGQWKGSTNNLRIMCAVSFLSIGPCLIASCLQRLFTRVAFLNRSSTSRNHAPTTVKPTTYCMA